MPLIITRATLELLLEEVVVSVAYRMRVCMPARVVTWFPPVPGPRPTPARAVVQVDLRYARAGYPDDLDPAALEVFQPAADAREPGELVGCYPLILVPVEYVGPWGMWARGPLLVGELGVLHWCDRSIDSWQVEGGGPTGPVDPGFSHAHGDMLGGPLNDAWFRPGIRSGLSMSAGPPGTLPSVVDPVSWEIGTADGLSTLKITTTPQVSGAVTPIMMELKTAGATLKIDAAALVQIGALASQFLAKAPPIVQILTALATDISAWVPVTEAALKTAMMLPTGTVGRIIALAGTISCTKTQGE